MTGWKQRRALGLWAERLRKVADDIQTLSTSGPLGLRTPDKMVVADGLEKMVKLWRGAGPSQV